VQLAAVKELKLAQQDVLITKDKQLPQRKQPLQNLLLLRILQLLKHITT